MPDAPRPATPLSVLVAGGTGFLGTRLREALTGRGHHVVTLTRGEPDGARQVRWDPYAGETGQLPQEAVDAADVVVNLAGSPTAGNPHSKKWAREHRRSRVVTTEVLARAVAASSRDGGPPAFVCGNGISYYGDHGAAVLTESADTRGHSLLTQTSRVWEEATAAASDAGARVCIVRTSPVMDPASAPLKQLRLLFLTGLGAKLGDGSQYMPMSSLRDWVGSVVLLVERDDASGPFNVCLPTAPTNAEFTRALAGAVHRPAFLFAPAPLLNVAAGAMAPELLGSLNVRPAALEALGYEFLDADVEALLATALA